MKSLRLALFTLLFVLPLSSAFAADFGVRAGRYNDSDEEFVGAEVLFDLGALNLNPNVEYWLTDDDSTQGTVNFDVLFELAPQARVAPYLGAGVGLAYLDGDFGDTRTDLIGNLIGGLQYKTEFLTPYAQVKYSRLIDENDTGDAGDDFAFVVGLRF
jgi:hypothetical protein